MTILAAARKFPNLLGSHVVAVAVISTTAAGIARSGLGSNPRNPSLAKFTHSMIDKPSVVTTSNSRKS